MRNGSLGLFPITSLNKNLRGHQKNCWPFQDWEGEFWIWKPCHSPWCFRKTCEGYLVGESDDCSEGIKRPYRKALPPTLMSSAASHYRCPHSKKRLSFLRRKTCLRNNREFKITTTATATASSETQGLLAGTMQLTFSGESLLQELKSPWELILTEPVPEMVEFRPLIEQKNIFLPNQSGRLAG